MEDPKPDTGYLISSEHKKIAADWFENKIGKKGCHICENRSWRVVDVYNTFVAFDIDKDQHRQDKVMLTITIQCNNCGVENSFGAEKMGIHPRQSPNFSGKK